MKFPKLKLPVSAKNRTILGSVCVILALIVGFVGVPLVAGAASSTVTVVRAKQDIPEGEKITDAMLEEVKIGKNNLPSGIINSNGQVTGKYAVVSITAQDMITTAKVSNSGGMYSLEDGQYLMSVSVKNFADALSGKLQAGDVVTVFFPPTSGNALTGDSGKAASTPPELQYVKVAAVTASNGTDVNVTANKSSDSEKNLPATVTLFVNARQAQILAGQESNTVHLALACRGGGTKAKNLLKQQAEYFTPATASSSTASTSSATPSDSAPSSSVPSQPSYPTNGSNNSAAMGVTQ